MTFALLVKIFVIAVVVMIVIARRRDKNSAVSDGLEQMRSSDWQGWVEIANSDYLPMFQGKIVATAAARNYAGALLLGVLLEENAPPALDDVPGAAEKYLSQPSEEILSDTDHILISEVANRAAATVRNDKAAIKARVTEIVVPFAKGSNCARPT